MKLALFFLLFCTKFAIAQQDLALVLPTKEIKKEVPISSSAKLYYDTESHLLTLLTSRELKNIELQLKTDRGQVIYKEKGLNVHNHYLLSISPTTPKGTYYIELNERGNLIELKVEI